MKTFKKVIALVTASVMALSVNAFALNIKPTGTINSVPAWFCDANDNYMCLMYNRETFDNSAYEAGSTYEQCVVHIYKKLNGEWKEYAELIPHSKDIGGWAPFKVIGITVAPNNHVLLTVEPYNGSGVCAALYYSLASFTEGERRIDGGYNYTGNLWGQSIFRVDWFGDFPFAFTPNGITGYQDGQPIGPYDMTALNGWNATPDYNYAYKKNAAGNYEIHDANTYWEQFLDDDGVLRIRWEALKWTLQAPESNIKKIAVAGDYAAAVGEDNYLYSYDLTAEAVDGAIPYTKVDSIGGTFDRMDAWGKHAAVYTPDTNALTIFNLETNELENTFTAPSGSGGYAEIEFNDSGVILAHSGDNGGIDVFKLTTGIEMNVDMLNAKYADLIDGEYVEHDDAMEYTKVEVSVVNGTLDDIDGNIIFAAYEGDLLTGVSVKPLSVESWKNGNVWTDYVPASTTLKAFYWTSNGTPIIQTPFEDTWED